MGCRENGVVAGVVPSEIGCAEDDVAVIAEAV